MTNITSVSMETMPANRTRGELIVLLGLLAIIGGAIGNQDGVAILGLIALVPGIAIAAAAKLHYVVRIGSASGESNALASKDVTYIQKIVNALNEAIIKRG